MSPRAESVLAEALKLSDDERIELAEHLVSSVGAERDGEIDKAWGDEAQRRLEAYKQGRVQAAPYEEVMRSIRERLKK